MSQTMLCLDSYTLNHPHIIGLPDESLNTQLWLQLFSNPYKARQALNDNSHFQEAWVVSSDGVDGINLAAALKHDGCEKVSFVSFDESGSTLSRCKAAGIECLNQAAFLKRYTQRKEEVLSDPFSHFELEEPLNEVPVRAKFDSAQETTQPLPESKINQILSAKLDAKNTSSEAFVLSVVSGSGGTGKSTVSLMCALALQQAGQRTLLLDADLQFGDLRFLSGVEEALEITDALASPERIASLASTGDMLALISSPKKLEHSELIAGKIKELLAYVKSFFDVIVVNTGAFWSEQHAQLIESSDKVLFVLDQRPSSIRSCNHALDLCNRCGIAVQSFVYVLNFCSRQALLTSMDVSCALQGATVRELKDGGKEVGELLAAGLPRELIKNHNVLYESVCSLLADLLPVYQGKQTKKPSLEDGFTKGKFKTFFRKKRIACL